MTARTARVPAPAGRAARRAAAPHVMRSVAGSALRANLK